MAKKTQKKDAGANVGIEQLLIHYLQLRPEHRAQLAGGLVLSGPIEVVGKSATGKLRLLSSREKGAAYVEVAKSDVLLSLATQADGGAAILWLRNTAKLKHVAAKKGSKAAAAEWLAPGAKLDAGHFQFGAASVLQNVAYALPSLATCIKTVC